MIRTGTFISKTGHLEGRRVNWRAVDGLILASLEHVPALPLDGTEIRLLMAHFQPGVLLKGCQAVNHIHNLIHLQFVMEGAFFFKTGKHSVLLKPGDGIVIPAGQVHYWLCQRTGVLFGASMDVTGQSAAVFTDYVKDKAADAFIPCSHPELLHGLFRMIAIALKPVPFHWRREMIGCELLLWLGRALHAALDLRPLKTPAPAGKETQAYPSRRLCEEAVRFIMSNFNRPIKACDAAGHIGITSRHLNRLFRCYLHDTAHGFLLRTRLEYADKMLKLSPVMKVKEMAFMSGFHSSSHFTQCFKQHFGRLPVESLDRDKAENYLISNYRAKKTQHLLCRDGAAAQGIKK